MKIKIVSVGQRHLSRGIAAADAFIALSSRDYEAAKARYPRVKVFRARNGVDLDLFHGASPHPDVAARYSGLPRPLVLCVSALLEYKRVELAIKAVCNIEGASLLVLGDGPKMPALADLIGSKVPPQRRRHFLLLGSIPFVEVPAYYSLADVFVHPADGAEAFGSVIVEAMAMGKPVVVNDDPVRREVVGNVGFFVDPTNIERFSKSILGAFNTWDYNRSNAAIEQANEYGWESLVTQYTSIFTDITAK